MTELSIAAVLEHYGADVHRVSETGWRPVKCPFHDDRLASGSVNLSKNGFRCHACGVHGDAIGLVMEREGMGYIDALSFASSVLGASIPDVPRSARRREAKRQPSQWRTRLFQ
jgi:DNA primase